MTTPSPSDLAHQALTKVSAQHRRYQHALAETCAEVKEVLQYWEDQGYDQMTAIALTGITLDNLPEGI